MNGAAAPGLPFDDSGFSPLDECLRHFRWNGRSTRVEQTRIIRDGCTLSLDTFANEFWTARQRAAHSLHEISYRACFKPQLPRFFIERLTGESDVVYDPFMGRGTTLLEAALLGRRACGCDVNPLSDALTAPRLRPPALEEVTRALAGIDFRRAGETPEELLVFYHPDTLREISALRRHLLDKERAGALTSVDRWIRMIATNRLTGHSAGFFSVYTLPPNQAVSSRAQAKINSRLNQVPPRRDVRHIILSKTRSLQRDCTVETRARLGGLADHHQIVVGNAVDTPSLKDESVTLVVTSPPFLDVVDYKTDNWLRGWFCGVDVASVPVAMFKRVEAWQGFVTSVLKEVRRVLRPGGHVAFEVGEVRGGALRLEEAVIPAGIAANLEPLCVLINEQQFTKTANCWGVANNRKGTNSNRVVVFRKP